MLKLNSNDNQSASDIVEQSSSSLEVYVDNSTDLFVDDMIYFSTETSFAILENTSSINNSFFNEKHPYIYLNSSGIVNKIILEDFPLGYQYLLSINGTNVDKANFLNGKYIFDFTKSKKSQALEIFSEITKGDEPTIENRSNYINFYRCDQIKINIPKGLRLDNHHITVCGYFKDNNKWLEQIRYYKLYTNGVIKLGLNHPTNSIILHTKEKLQKPISFYLTINEEQYGEFEIQSSCVLKFKNPDNLFNGKQNDFLNNSQNKSSINLSRCEVVLVFPDDPEIVNNIHISQNYYAIRSKQTLNMLFAT